MTATGARNAIEAASDRRLAWLEYDRERKRKWRAGRERIPTRFVGADGEGGNVEGSHEYLLLRVGNHVLETGKPLLWQECLAFLADLPRDGVCYVGYFFDYDVTMMLRGVREERVRRLLDRDCRTFNGVTYPVDIEQFQVEYLPRKEFKVRRKGHGTRWTIINDVGSFFQCAFVKALELWEIGTVEERAAIAEGKEARSDFGAVTQQERDYNALEIDLLQKLMTAFRKVCQNVGYVPSKWQGPGCMASVMLRRHGIPPRRRLYVTTVERLMENANAAYYGGRFETTTVGPVDGPIYQYDINSAYPAAIRELPCLEHGEWALGRKVTDGLYLAHGRFTATADVWLYGFPVRRPDGSIYFPGTGNGWYWSHEIRSAQHQSFEADEVWSYVRRCECVPFAFVNGLYRQRVELGKTARGRVLKLGLNSLYGKMAQSIGAASYANPIWAGLITSRTRALLLDAICDSVSHGVGFCGRDVLMLATDGIFTTTPRGRLPLGAGLGEWEVSEHEEIFLVQPGLYLTGDAPPKTRGLPRRIVVEKAAEFADAHSNGRRSVTVPVRNFIGLRQALHRNAFGLAGQWQTLTKEVTFDVSSKRDPETFAPYAGGTEVESVPYAKAIGAWRDARIELADQPDWADGLFGEDWS